MRFSIADCRLPILKNVKLLDVLEFDSGLTEQNLTSRLKGFALAVQTTVLRTELNYFLSITKTLGG